MDATIVTFAVWVQTRYRFA